MIRTISATLTLVLGVAACGGSAAEVVMDQTDSPPPSSHLDTTGEFSAPSAPVEQNTVGQSPIESDPIESDPVESDPVESVGLEPIVDPPPATFVPPEAAAVAVGLGEVTFDLPGCPATPRGAVTDKANQRYWLCMDGAAVTAEIPMTTASGNYGLPPVGTYEVFARDEDAFGIGGEALERFVAFYTTPKGNRIAFHEVVDQDPDTVGDLDQRGASAGCFRVREADSVQVWEFLQIGDPVVVLTN